MQQAWCLELMLRSKEIFSPHLGQVSLSGLACPLVIRRLVGVESSRRRHGGSSKKGGNWATFVGLGDPLRRWKWVATNAPAVSFVALGLALIFAPEEESSSDEKNFAKFVMILGE